MRCEDPASHGLQLEDIEAPGAEVDVEARVDQGGAVPVVELAAHLIGETPGLAGQTGEGQPQMALPLMIGIVDDDDIAGVVRPVPGISDEVLGGRIAGPGLPRLQERPGTVAKRIVRLQHRQEPVVEGSDLRIRRLDRPAAQMRRQAHPRALDLALLEEAQTRREEGDDGGRLMPRPGKGRRGARLVVVLEEARQPILIVEPGDQMAADLRRHRHGTAGRRAACRSSSRSPAAAAPIRGPNRPRP